MAVVIIMIYLCLVEKDGLILAVEAVQAVDLLVQQQVLVEDQVSSLLHILLKTHYNSLKMC